MGEAPDPVADADRYRAYLLDALGDDDPAMVQAATVGEMRAVVAEAGDRLRVRPAPAEWSALECLGHILDSELVLAARSRWILAEDRPDIVGYDQDLWVTGLDHGSDDPGELLALFEALRTANLALWARRPVEDRERIGLHRERGPESYGLLFRLSAGHDRIHLAQARAALEAVSRS